MNDIEIDFADVKDIKDIARLSYQVGKMHDEAMPNYFLPTSEQEHLMIIEKMFIDENVKIFKAVKDNVICGFVVGGISIENRKGYVHSKIGYIYNLGVDEAYRKQGIGAKLVQKVEEYFVSLGVSALDIEVFAFNNNAKCFYEENGYDVCFHTMRKVLK